MDIKSETPNPLFRILLLGGVLVAVATAWQHFHAPPAAPVTPPSPAGGIAVPQEFKQGEELSKVVCGSCHIYPEPALMDKVTWGMMVLPHMALKLGFYDGRYEDLGLEPRVVEAGIIPRKPIINVEEWRAICTYYLATAPVELAQPSPQEIDLDLKQFELIHPSFRGVGMTTMVKIDPVHHEIYLGERMTNTLVALDQNGKLRRHMQVASPPVDIVFRTNGAFITLIGSYSPSDELEGKLVWLGDADAKGKSDYHEVLTPLARPVKSIFGDLNQDGREDILVCGFGNLLGRLSWFENTGEQFKEHVLVDRPGAIAAALYDFNHDGKPDIIVMMAQAREGIYILYNLGGGEFSAPQPVAEYQPAWGSSGFELVDFNNDGFMDILATNGDNGDNTGYLPPFKPYHGIRLYLNDGQNHFKEAWFYQMNGAYKAVARDFNGDGKLDIAAISFYPDYRRSRFENFVYLENLGGMKFKAHSFEESLSGRWITMDVNDLDGDGKPDIVLGSMQFGPTLVPHGLQEYWATNGPTLLILKNKGK